MDTDKEWKDLEGAEKFQRIVSEEKEEEIMKSLGLTPVTINLDKETIEALEVLSDYCGLFVPILIRAAIRDYLNKKEEPLTRMQYYEDSDNS